MSIHYSKTASHQPSCYYHYYNTPDVSPCIAGATGTQVHHFEHDQHLNRREVKKGKQEDKKKRERKRDDQVILAGKNEPSVFFSVSGSKTVVLIFCACLLFLMFKRESNKKTEVDQKEMR